METTLPGLARFFRFNTWICFTEAHRLPHCCCSSFPLEFVPPNNLLPKTEEKCWDRCQPESPPASSWTAEKHHSAPNIFLGYTHRRTSISPQQPKIYFRTRMIRRHESSPPFFSVTRTQDVPLSPFLLELQQAALIPDFHLKSNLSVHVMIKFLKVATSAGIWNLSPDPGRPNLSAALLNWGLLAKTPFCVDC